MLYSLFFCSNLTIKTAVNSICLGTCSYLFFMPPYRLAGAKVVNFFYLTRKKIRFFIFFLKASFSILLRLAKVEPLFKLHKFYFAFLFSDFNERLLQCGCKTNTSFGFSYYFFMFFFAFVLIRWFDVFYYVNFFD